MIEQCELRRPTVAAEEKLCYDSMTRYSDRLRRLKKERKALLSKTSEELEIIPGYEAFGRGRSLRQVYDDLLAELKKLEAMNLNEIDRLIEELRHHFDDDTTKRGIKARSVVRQLVTLLGEIKATGILAPYHVLLNVVSVN